LSICQLHISLNRTAQIYLELHFCVELHTKKALQVNRPSETIHRKLSWPGNSQKTIGNLRKLIKLEVIGNPKLIERNNQKEVTVMSSLRTPSEFRNTQTNVA